MLFVVAQITGLSQPDEHDEDKLRGQEGVKLTVVLEEHRQLFQDGKNGAAMRSVFDYLQIDMLCEFRSPLCPACWAKRAAIIGEGQEKATSCCGRKLITTQTP